MKTKSSHKAVGLISGGMDSALAARLIKAQGIKVYGIFFSMPWGCGHLRMAQKLAQSLSIPLKIFPLREEFIEIIRHPRYGHGSAFNPCRDCHILMLQKAKNYMHELQADFVFTGEVLGQRPMSQLTNSLNLIERESGLKGQLLRPLSARHLNPTQAEIRGLVDREKLLNITGRSRQTQYRLVKKLGLKNFAAPAGGCLLTDRHFSNRLKDALNHGIRHWNDLLILRWGRHFRLDDKTKTIIGRDERENAQLINHCHPQDYILELPDEYPGPTGILQANSNPEPFFKITAGLVQRYSNMKSAPSQMVTCRHSWGSEPITMVQATRLNEDDIRHWHIL